MGKDFGDLENGVAYSFDATGAFAPSVEDLVIFFELFPDVFDFFGVGLAFVLEVGLAGGEVADLEEEGLFLGGYGGELGVDFGDFRGGGRRELFLFGLQKKRGY